MSLCCFGFESSGGGTSGAVTGSGTLNFLPKWTPNGTTLGNSQLFDNGTTVGLGTITPTAGTKFHIFRNINDFLYEMKVENPNAGISSAASILISSDVGKMEFGQLSSTHTTYLGYGQLGDTFIRSGVGARNMNFLTDPSNSGKFLFFSRLNPTTDAAFPSFSIDGSKSGFNTLPNANSVVYIKGTDSTSTNFGLKIENSALSPLLYVKNNSDIGFGCNPTNAKFEFSGGNILLLTFGARFGSVAVGGYSSWGLAANEISTLPVTTGTHLILQYTEKGNVGFGTNAPTASIHAVGLGGANYVMKLESGKVAASALQTGNAGLASGDLYVDTAANILANGDLVVGRKV